MIFHKLYGATFDHRSLIIQLIERFLQEIIYGASSTKDVVGVNELFDLMSNNLINKKALYQVLRNQLN